MNKYCVKTEGGKVLEPTGPGSFEIPDDKLDDFNAEFEEFQAIEVKIDKNPIEFDLLEKVKLTPGELAAIENLIEVPE